MNIISTTKINRRVKMLYTLIFVFIFVFSNLLSAEAAFNKQINYQGKLTDASNVAVSDGTYNMEFKLYTSGGATLWTETRTTTDKVQVTGGLFSVMLGEVSTLSGVDFNQTLYLGVNIGGTGTPGWDGEMTPRKKLGAVPAAVMAETVTGAAQTAITSLGTLTSLNMGGNITLGANTFTTTNTTVVTNLNADLLDGQHASAFATTGSLASYLPLAGGTMTGGITNSTSINPLTTLAESWIGPSSTTGVYFKGGNVGVGTTGPAANLQVAGSTSGVQGINTSLILGANGGGTFPGLSYFNTSGVNRHTIRLNTAGSDQLEFYANSGTVGTPAQALAMAISTAGNVGIGTTTPAVKLEIKGDGQILSMIPTTSDNYIYQNIAISGVRLMMGVNDSGGTDLFGGLANSSVFGSVTDTPVQFATHNTVKMTILNDGNVGIGTTTPNNLIQVAGLINFNDTDLNTSIGKNAGANIVAGAQYNTFLGYEAGKSGSGTSTNAADYNTAVGYQSLYSNTTGYRNVANGTNSLYSNTSGYYNTASGYNSLYNNTTGIENAAYGSLSLYSNKANNRSTAIGYRSMYYADDRASGRDTYNTAVGYEALLGSSIATNNTGRYNTAIGDNVLYSNTTGNYNSAMGKNSLLSNTTGNYNSAVGYGSLYSNTTGNENTANGVSSLRANTTGSSNSAMGNFSLYSNTTGSNNIAFGYNAGNYHSDGSTGLIDPENSVYIGAETRGKDNDDSNSIVIGYQAISNGSNTATIGNSSLLRTYITGLNLKAGTATAGTAPLKFTSGTNLGTTEAGAVEYDGSHLYFTATNGGSRYQLDQQGGGLTVGTSAITSGTSGRVLYDNGGVLGEMTTTGSGTVLALADSPTFTTNITTPLVVGGNGTLSTLIFKTTSGVGATGANMRFLVGNKGATEAMTILNNGDIGMGITSPGKKLDVSGAIRTDNQFISTILTGTAPLAVTSTTLVDNLNSDLIDGHHSSDFQTALTNPVTGLGTANYLAKFTLTGSAIGDSSIFDNGTSVGIGTASSLIGKLDVRVPNIASDVAVASFGMLDYGHLEIHQVVSPGYAAPTGSLFKYVDEFGNPYNSLFMDRLGNVGINNTSPIYKLDVSGDIASSSVISPYIVGGILTTSDLYFKTTTAAGASGADMHFLVGNNGATEAMTILNDGKVGINNPAPSEALDVNGNIETTGSMIFGTAGFTFEQVASPASVTVKKGTDAIMVFDEL